jgi:hypothetical protein
MALLENLARDNLYQPSADQIQREAENRTFVDSNTKAGFAWWSQKELA